MIDLFAAAAVIFSCFYFLTAVFIAYGVYRIRRRKLPSELPFVSVIVCARNEGKVIRRCLESLVKLDYPPDKMEIILVDDESEDSTRAVLEEFAAGHSFFSVLSTAGKPLSLPGKQRPLNLGISESSGEIILITDADCTVNPGWIKSHLTAYHDKRIGIVGGITRISGGSGGLFPYLQNCDQVSKLAVAMGCAGLGFPLTIMGNNMSFRSAAYVACGGLRKIGPSIVEDVDLMYAIVRNTSYRLGCVRADGGTVFSAPLDSFMMLVKQRLRMSKLRNALPSAGKVLLGIEIVMAAVFSVSVMLVPWNPLTAVVTGAAWILGTGIVLLTAPGTTAGDFFFVPAMLVFQVLYGVFLFWKIALTNSAVEWKGRVYAGNKGSVERIVG